MSLLVKALGLIFTAAVFSVVVKKHSGEFSFLISVAAVCAVTLYIILTAKSTVLKLKELFAVYTGSDEYITVAVKAVIIAYLSSTVADTCRDQGQSALAAKAELAGKCVIFVLTVPLFITVLNAALGFINI